MTKTYLLFDAGGTIVFPHMRVLCDTANKYGLNLLEEDVFRVYCELIFALDLYAKEYGALSNPYPQGVGWEFFERLGLRREALAQASKEISAYNERENLWAYTYPWVSDALKKLQEQGYCMSVLSNSDGRIRQLLTGLNLAQYFEYIFDSQVLGMEKPNPIFFEFALNKIGKTPSEVLYIGDVFYIDVWGANNVGMPAVHLDPLNLYEGWNGARITSVAALSNALEQGVFQKDAFFSAQRFRLQFS